MKIIIVIVGILVALLTRDISSGIVVAVIVGVFGYIALGVRSYISTKNEESKTEELNQSITEFLNTQRIPYDKGNVSIDGSGIGKQLSHTSVYEVYGTKRSNLEDGTYFVNETFLFVVVRNSRKRHYDHIASHINNDAISFNDDSVMRAQSLNETLVVYSSSSPSRLIRKIVELCQQV